MADTVTTTMGMAFKAFNVPNFATIDLPARPKQEGFKELPSIPVEELTPAALDALASRWLDNLYAKCERPSPFKIATP